MGDFGTIPSYDGNRTPAGKPTVFSVVNGASFEPGVASAAWITITGINLSTGTRTWTSDFVNNKLPTQLDGVSVNVMVSQPMCITSAPPRSTPWRGR